MLFNNDSEGHGGRLRRVRDIVEIIAIVAAGVWAFYTFIYQNQIVPAQAKAEANFETTLEKVSEHNGLIGVRLTWKIHNIGTAADWFIAYAVSVVGERITPSARQNALTFDDDTANLNADYVSSKSTPVFVQGLLTFQADPNGKFGLYIEPGGESSKEEVFYVRAGQYDRLRSYIIARFTRDDHLYPTRFVKGKDGLPAFAPHIVPSGVEQTGTFNASLDLNSK